MRSSAEVSRPDGTWRQSGHPCVGVCVWGTLGFRRQWRHNGAMPSVQIKDVPSVDTRHPAKARRRVAPVAPGVPAGQAHRRGQSADARRGAGPRRGALRRVCSAEGSRENPAGRACSSLTPSVLATALADDTDDGDRARARLRGEALAAPDLVDLEVTSVLRRRLAGNHIDSRRADLALTDLLALPLERVPSLRLISRCWELRDNLSVYDGAYVALAEALAVPLVTADARLARATGPQCPIEVLR